MLSALVALLFIGQRVVRLTRRDTMFTIFYLFELMGLVFGVVVGAAVGKVWLGCDMLPAQKGQTT